MCGLRDRLGPGRRSRRRARRGEGNAGRNLPGCRVAHGMLVAEEAAMMLRRLPLCQSVLQWMVEDSMENRHEKHHPGWFLLLARAHGVRHRSNAREGAAQEAGLVRHGNAAKKPR